jgi:hypothetical protein
MEYFIRRTIEEAKEFWFHGDLTISIKRVGVGEGVRALPLHEVRAGARYVEKLKGCSTLGEVKAVFDEYKADPDAPKILPQLFDPLTGADFDAHFIEQYIAERGIGPGEFDALYMRHMENELGKNFIPGDVEIEGDFELYMATADPSAIAYRFNPFEQDYYKGLDHWVLWTNAWVPTEVVMALGRPSEQYLNVDGDSAYIFTNIELFVQEFEKNGFTFIFDDPDFLELIGEL